MQDESVNTNDNDAPSLLMDNDVEVTQTHPLAEGAGEDEADQSDDTQVDTEDTEDSGQSNTEATKAPLEQQTQQPTQPQTLEDPGNFQPGDYGFDVVLADGTNVRIEKPEDIDKLPESPEFANVKDHTAFITNYSRMVNGIDNDRRKYDDDKKAFDEQQGQVQAREEFVTQLDNSFKYLESKGKLPGVPAQYADADWNDPEVAKQPGVKERIEVIQYMARENAERTKLGLPSMTALEAFSELRNKGFEEQQAQKTQKQNELRKQRGSMVAGASAPQPGKTNTDMIVGSGGTLRDLGY